jgi:hypothetical protein
MDDWTYRRLDLSIHGSTGNFMAAGKFIMLEWWSTQVQKVGIMGARNHKE